MWGFLIALLSGALMSVQGVFNTQVTKSCGVWLTAAWVQFSAFFVCMIGWYLTGKTQIQTLFQIHHKYLLLGGVIGAFITFTVVQSMKSMGPAAAVLVIVVSQIAIAYLIELFGWFGVQKAEFSWQKLIGLFLAIAGIFLFEHQK